MWPVHQTKRQRINGWRRKQSYRRNLAWHQCVAAKLNAANEENHEMSNGEMAWLA